MGAGFALILAASVPAQTVTNVFWYHLGESATIGTDSVNNINLNVINTAPTLFSDTPGDLAPLYDSSLSAYFQYGVFPNYLWTNAITLTPNSSFAMEAWIKPDYTTPVTGAIVYNGATGPNGIGLYQFSDQFGVLLGGVTASLSGVSLTAGQWTEIAFTWENGLLTLYQDGVAVKVFDDSAPASQFISSAGQLTIGGAWTGTSGYTNPFTGKIDEVRLFQWTGTFNPATMLNYSTSAVPEPSTCAIVSGAAALGFAIRRRRLRQVTARQAAERGRG